MEKIEIGCYVTSKQFPGLGIMPVLDITGFLNKEYKCRLDGKLESFEANDLRLRDLCNGDVIRIMYMPDIAPNTPHPYIGLSGTVQRYDAERGEFYLYTEFDKTLVTGIKRNRYGNIDLDSFTYRHIK